jgi:hypothetical protein
LRDAAIALAQNDDATIFRERCIARASEYAQGNIDLQSAVDSCQQLAEALGLAFLDQDAVQTIMAEIFGAADEITIDPQYGRASISTVDALMYSLRERGAKALAEPDTIRRISELSDEQFREVVVRVQKFNPHIAPPWKPEEVEALFVARRKIHANS